MSLVVVATITPQPGKLHELVATFESITADVQNEPGCELYAIYTDDDVLVTIERWADDAALDVHMKGDALKKLSAVAATLLAKAPEIHRLQPRNFGSAEKGSIG